MDSKSSRYQSRILREMRNNAENPFSPPSSTGSHGTVTLTSQLSIPDGESTRQPMLPVINTSVLGRTFPEWKQSGKENTQPSSPPALNDTESLFGPDSPRLRAHYQAPIVEDTMELNPPVNPARGNLTTLLDTLRTARSEKAEADEESVKRSSQISPKDPLNAGLPANAARRVSRHSHSNSGNNHGSTSPSPSIINQTAHSFFVPNLNHLNDFVSGTLRWASLKNGTPVFVKHGKVHDREAKISLDYHADFEAVPIPHEEEEIFVSMDKIREEIQTLQEHDEHMSKQAGQLQDEVMELQSQVVKLKSRKDSGMGSDTDDSVIVQLTTQNTQLEEQISSLKARLEQATRKISLNEIHNQSFVAERDEALQRASDHITTIKRLQTRNDAITQQKLEFQQALTETEEELNSERALFDNLHQKYEIISEERGLLKEDNLGLERHNEDLFNNNKLLQQKNSQLERENKLLQDKVRQLQALVEEFNRKLSQTTENRQYTQQFKGFTPGPSKPKPTKVTQNSESVDRHTTASETPIKVTSPRPHLPEQDDDTRESVLTQESPRRYSPEPSAPGPSMTKSKNPRASHMQEPGDRYTMMSEMSAKTTTSQTDLQMQEDYTQQIDLTREPHVDSDQENMTSALFIDDITMDSNKKFIQRQRAKGAATVRVLSPILSVDGSSSETEDAQTGKQKETDAPPTLTQSAKRVLNNLCQDHECYNCMVCARIQSHRHESNGKCGKKTVRVDRPVPVTDRVERQPAASTHDYEDQPTLRPSQDPALALAKVMKGLKDEERHIRTAVAKKQAIYDECDASVNRRLWKQLDAEIRVLRKRRDLKRDQIYDLHDVLEGQKANSQLMSQEAVDMTINSVLSKDPNWNGGMDY
ncbi:putative rhoptry protein [Rosellinia necatrix]|uniref:Putative rhoptry protein n=1 Tax=Rosellinia necatrix TaxID=77044 RepID=A0A1W2TBU4_ROSNE|nr:putative rhoptry protein [Rosellinia necatrix]